MQKRFILYLPLILLIIILAFLSTRDKTNNSFKTPIIEVNQKEESEFTHKVTFPKEEISVIIANTDKARQVGLGGRDSLGTKQGMLFDFGYDDTYPTFWMKGMNFPIDIIWINDNVVSDISKNIPYPSNGETDEELILYRPNSAIDKVLEVNAGFVEKNEIEIGDEITISEK